MPDNIINFKRAKKRAGYTAKDKQAANNRIKFGRTKPEKNLSDGTRAKADKHLDGRKLDDE